MSSDILQIFHEHKTHMDSQLNQLKQSHDTTVQILLDTIQSQVKEIDNLKSEVLINSFDGNNDSRYKQIHENQLNN